jgi:hypothetical protein
MGINTQTPQTRALAKALRKTHRINDSWRETARIHGITTPSGKPSKGLAYRIAKSGYEPVGLQLRARLGLPADECPECHQHICDRPQLRVRVWKHLDDLTVNQVRWLFDNRETA